MRLEAPPRIKRSGSKRLPKIKVTRTPRGSYSGSNTRKSVSRRAATALITSRKE